MLVEHRGDQFGSFGFRFGAEATDFLGLLQDFHDPLLLAQWRERDLKAFKSEAVPRDASDRL